MSSTNHVAVSRGMPGEHVLLGVFAAMLQIKGLSGTHYVFPTVGTTEPYVLSSAF